MVEVVFQNFIQGLRANCHLLVWAIPQKWLAVKRLRFYLSTAYVSCQSS